MTTAIRVTIREFRECTVEFYPGEGRDPNVVAETWQNADPQMLLSAPDTQVRVVQSWSDPLLRTISSTVVTH